MFKRVLSYLLTFTLLLTCLSGLTLAAAETRHYEFLKQNRPSTVGVMRMNGTLEGYLKEVNQEATEIIHL